jgi:excisionase family DNA binding protein
MVMMTEEQLLTVPDVAKRLRVSEWTVRDWLRDGKIRGFRIGGRKTGWRVRASEIERFLSEAEGRTEGA